MRVEVPGKLVLVGEYAVVDGGPALVMAVPQGVACDRTDGPVGLETPDGDDRFVRAALQAVGAPDARYRFSASVALDLPGKPGFGGSAAATVAALLAGGFTGSAAELARLATDVHRAVQGSGSGIDTAASAYGGTLRFQAGQVTPIACPTPIVVWSGASARTGPRLEVWRAWADKAGFLADSAGWVDALPADPAPVARAAWRGLCAMARQAGIPYQTPAIDRIVALAEAHQGGAKPSGAGGGDCVVAWIPGDPAPFLAAVAREFPVLPVQPAPAPRVVP